MSCDPEILKDPLEVKMEIESEDEIENIEDLDDDYDLDDFDDNELVIDEQRSPDISTDKHESRDFGGEDDDEDEEDGHVRLDKLPRPVNELNCRQARTYLVKLLRAANNGLNPHYGNPEMKPQFWPDYYWPWEKLTDVHTKPRGMNEPLQYSEMMKLAIARGYQYYGYDPATYFDLDVDQSKDNRASSPLLVKNSIVTYQEKEEPILPEKNPSAFLYEHPPPRLPRGLSQLNCVQARTTLAKLLRYQQCGNNPVYGSPETKPPWWPEELIRWVDLVDLRGKPPYLPESKSYTEVLKDAISSAYGYYGYNPEVYVEGSLKVSGLIGDTQRVFPVIKKVQGVVQTPIPMKSSTPPLSGAQPSPFPNSPVLSNIPILELPNISPMPIATLSNIIGSHGSSTETKSSAILVETPEMPKSGIESDDDFDENEDMPPKLLVPIGKMNCSQTRTALAKLIRFHCGNQNPNYGNPTSMPSWWPSQLIDWSQIKNLSHRYTGYLGNTYSNCLRIAVIRGYAHYGLDANEYVDESGLSNSPGGNTGLQIDTSGSFETGEDTPLFTKNSNSFVERNFNTVTEKMAGSIKSNPAKFNSNISQLLPVLPLQPIPIEDIEPHFRNQGIQANKKPLKGPKHPRFRQTLLRRYEWFPPLVSDGSLQIESHVISNLKKSKVILDRSCVDKHIFTNYGTTLVNDKPKMLFDFLRADLVENKFTDISLKSDIANIPGQKIHKLILAAQSPKMKQILLQMEHTAQEPEIVLADASKEILDMVVQVLYTGSITIQGKDQFTNFKSFLDCLQMLGILRNLRPSILIRPHRRLAGPASRKLKFRGERQERYQEDPELSPPDHDKLPNTKKDETSQHKIVKEPQTSNNNNIKEEENEGSMVMSGTPRRSKRVPVPRRFSSGSESGDPDPKPKETTTPLKHKQTINPQETEMVSQKRKAPESDEPNQRPEKIRRSDPVSGRKKSSSPRESEKVSQLKKGDVNPTMKLKTSPRIKLKADQDQVEGSKPKLTADSTTKSGTRNEKSNSSQLTKESTTNNSKRSSGQSESLQKTLNFKRRKLRRSGSIELRTEAKNPNFKSVDEDKLKVKLNEGNLEFVKWLMEKEFLIREPPSCCDDGTVGLDEDEESVDKVSWICSKCETPMSIRKGSIFGLCEEDSLDLILKLIKKWSDNTSLLLCQESTGASVDKVFLWYEHCREYYGKISNL